jgi:hypothetical protein
MLNGSRISTSVSGLKNAMSEANRSASFTVSATSHKSFSGFFLDISDKRSAFPDGSVLKMMEDFFQVSGHNIIDEPAKNGKAKAGVFTSTKIHYCNVNIPDYQAVQTSAMS